MDVVYLGIFQTILNWVIEKILSPVFKFVANLLATVLGWVFDTVLGPLLQAVLIPLAELVINLVFEAFAEVFYRIFVAVLTLVDYMQIAFDILIGIKNVTYTTPDGNVIREPLLDVLFYQEAVNRVFWMVTILALSIAFIFTIYATAKSAFDLDFEGRRPVGMVLKAFFKTGLTFLSVPLFVLFMLKLSTIILIGVSAALTQGNNATLGNTIFLVSSMDAALAEEYNTSYEEGSGGKPKISNIGFEDSLRSPYAQGEKTYADIEEVRKEFKFSRFDYLVGYGVSIFMLIILAICLIQFVQRIFEILLLYVVSPLFVSIMPLDDGEKFGGWRELFIAKCFMGFGAAIGMRLYLMIVPIIMSNSIDFTGGGYMSTEMNYVVKLLIIMGGAFAIFKSSSMLTMLLNWRAGDSENATAASVGGAMYGYTVGKATHGISRGLHKGIDRAHQRSSEKKEKGHAFHGSSGMGMGGSGTGGIPGLSGNKKSLQGGGFGDGSTRYRFDSGRMSRFGLDKDDMPNRKRGLTMKRDSSGKLRAGYQGEHLHTEVGKDGKYRVRSIDRKFLKMETKKDGRKSVTMPIVSLRDGPNGKLKFDGLNMGVFKTGRGLDGKQHLKGLNFGVVKTGRGLDGKQHVNSVNMKAFQFHHLNDGHMHLSHALGQNMEYAKGTDGKYHLSGIDMEKADYHIDFDRGIIEHVEEKDWDAYLPGGSDYVAPKKDTAAVNAREQALARARQRKSHGAPVAREQQIARQKQASAARRQQTYQAKRQQLPKSQKTYSTPPSRQQTSRGQSSQGGAGTRLQSRNRNGSQKFGQYNKKR